MLRDRHVKFAIGDAVETAAVTPDAATTKTHYSQCISTSESFGNIPEFCAPNALCLRFRVAG